MLIYTAILRATWRQEMFCFVVVVCRLIREWFVITTLTKVSPVE